MTRRIAGLCLMISLLACAGKKPPISYYHPAEKDSIVNALQIPFPILLLHGLGQKATVWEDAKAIQYYQDSLKLGFGGIIHDGVISVEEGHPISTTRDFFTIAFNNPTDSVSAWIEELARAIQSVRKATSAKDVILIGYSMGGLAGRAYVVAYAANHSVKRLVTIGSPHQGSPLAVVWNWKNSISKKNKALQLVFSPFFSQLENQADMPLDAPALRDLREPEDGNQWLATLNESKHPENVEYISIISKVSLSQDIAKLKREAGRLFQGNFNLGLPSTLATTLENFLKSELVGDGDLVVPIESQNMNLLPCFKNNNLQGYRIPRAIELDVNHQEYLKKNTEIQRLSLENKPELKNNRIEQNGKNIQFVFDFVDYLPLNHIIVKIAFLKPEQMTGDTIIVPSDAIHLVKTTSGDIVYRVRQTIPNEKIKPPFSIRYIVENSFKQYISNSYDMK